jgi:ABC-type oligopeptide transport system substrate-binding subunit
MNYRAAILLICALAINACGGGDPASTESVLHRGTGEEPESLDVHKSSSTEAGHVQRDIGEGLVGYSRTGELVPAAAVSWTVSDDSTEYLFSLRPEGRWSNGDPVTASDFVYSYRRLVDPETAAVYVESISDVRNATEIIAGDEAANSLGVEAVGSHTLQIQLRRPVPYFIGLLAHPSMFPVHRGSIEAHGDAHARPGNMVSNGAYELVNWEVGSYIEIARNEDYWNNDQTAIDRVRHYVTPEPMVELNRYRAGELHVTRTIPPGSFAQMKEARPGEVRVSPALGVYYYGFNMTKPPFSENPKLREALSLAVDRSVIVELVGRGEAVAYSFVPNGITNYEPSTYSWANSTQDERNRTAQQLYREAGYGEMNPLKTEIRYNTHETHRQIAVAVQSMWNTVLGVEATLVNEEFQVLLANMQAKDVTQVFRANWAGDYNDAHTFLSNLESDNPANFTGYASDDFDSLMERAAAQTAPARRRVFLEQAEQEMLDDHPLIPIYFYVNRGMVSPKVRGWGDNVLNYHYSQHLSLATSE